MVNQRLWDMEDAEGSKEKFLWQVSLTQRGTQGKICTKLRTWRRACCMRLQILLGRMHVVWNAAGNVGHMDRNTLEWGEGKGIL